MIDITQDNLESELIAESMQQPVLLDIWAPWCGPCRTLGPMLEKLEVAYEGRFKLGKLNSDDQPEIAGQLSSAFGVRSIPFCVLFVQGQPVDGFVGAVPESEIRQFLDRHVPSIDALDALAEAEEAEALVEEGDTDAALARLQQAVAIDPGNDGMRFDYVKLLLEMGRTAQARQAYEPVVSKALGDARLAALGHWLAACERAPGLRDRVALEAAVAADRRDFDARFEMAQQHFAAARFTQAMDELLEIILRDKAWRTDLARKTYVAILELMTKPVPKPGAKDSKEAKEAAKGTVALTGRSAEAGSDPVIDQYRRKLSMALF